MTPVLVHRNGNAPLRDGLEDWEGRAHFVDPAGPRSRGDAGNQSAVCPSPASRRPWVRCGVTRGHPTPRLGAPFANPRNDFWRLLVAAGFTQRLLEPQEPGAPAFGIGLTNAARRTTRGSGDLRAADFEGAHERLEEIATGFEPGVIAFVGKAAYHGPLPRASGARAQQERSLGGTALFVLPSTSPANAAVPWDERLRWFRALTRLVTAC